MKLVPFVKATACGNDFLLVETGAVGGDRMEFTRRICDRNHGVGADGVEWLAPSATADLKIDLINADGSPAEISGNGTRCAAAHWISGKLADQVTIETGAGVKLCKLTRRSDPEFEFETEMGPAQVGEARTVAQKTGRATGIPVSTGNPHFVMFVDDFPVNWQQQAAEIGVHPDFPEGVNVELVKASGNSGDSILLRIFERGAGETQSSGTGSCAAAVAAIASGRASSPVRIIAPGGAQTVRWEKGEICLSGPARLICRGEFLWAN